jgi:predicted dehydrogenase
MLLGPVKSVVGFAQKLRPDPAKPPLAPDCFTHDAPGQAAAVLEHASGALTTLITTVENQAYTPELRIYGTKGAIHGNDPNQFHGPVKLALHYKPVEEVPLPFAHCGKHRGAGIWDIAGAITENRPHRLGPDFALHQLDVMLAVIESQKSGKRIDLTTTFAPQPPMPTVAPTVAPTPA